ncbi:MAG: hypothetical protein KDA41_13360, partial [Planctomycetales bacterium]|nr:hypothetical protein [Planctomycetales bacterium]
EGLKSKAANVDKTKLRREEPRITRPRWERQDQSCAMRRYTASVAGSSAAAAARRIDRFTAGDYRS